MRVATVIRCRNEEAHIGRLLTGIARQTRKADEVIVVDSGSTDATLSIASQFAVKIVHIEASEFSFGRACNVGCAATDADVAVFVSAHCYPLYDSWLANLIEPLDRDDTALAYGRQCAPPDASYSEGRLFAQWYPPVSDLRQRHPFCNNANSAIRRSIWAEMPFDENLTGLEDMDWAKRALDRGRLVSYVAEAPVVHVHDESFQQTLNRYRREAIAHKRIYEEQRVSLLDAARMATVNIASDYGAAYRDGRLSRREMLDIPRFRMAQFYGTYRGFGQAGPVPALLKRRFFYPDRLDTAFEQSPDRAEHRIDYDVPVRSTGYTDVSR